MCKSISETGNLRALRTLVHDPCEHFQADPCFDSDFASDFIRRDFNVSQSAADDYLPGQSRYDKRFLDIVESRISVNEKGNVQMPLTFTEEPNFPDNHRAVFMRTKNTLLRVNTDKETATKCVNAMQAYIDAGHVEQLPPGDRGVVGRTNYIAVFHVAKGNKVRIVFDGAATYHGSSLNDRLLRGPDVANKLIGVLLRFRMHRVGFVADVECMFHSFHVSPEDRDALRFYWWANNDPSKEITAYRANVHVFGNKCSPALATYGLRYTTTDPDAASLTDAKDFILNNMYVDDGMGSADTVEDAVQILKDARSILSKYNIRLHKIVSPSKKFLSAFPSSELAPDVKTLDISRNSAQSALGVTWNIEFDHFSLRYVEPKTEFTRRAILSVNGSVYDPMGMASPISLGGRILQRKFISSGTKPFGWDEPLPEEYLSEWKSWIAELPNITELTIPRCLFPDRADKPLKAELHVFCDASEEAIGHVMYVRSIYADDSVYVSFLFANSKVAPRSANTMPRLELCAAVEAAQSASYIMAELPKLVFSSVLFYSDSMIVLGYISNKERAFSKYVEKRVDTVLRLTSDHQWRYISTLENAADLATRPQTATDLKSSRWFAGPVFLSSHADSGPLEHLDLHPLAEPLPESKVLITKTPILMNPILDQLSKRFSSWNKTVNTITYILKFVALCRKRKPDSEKLKWSAVSFIIREAQMESFPEEYARLSQGKGVRNHSLIVSLSPFLDSDNVMRVGGRLRNADLPYDEKHPRLLPASHFSTNLVVAHAHELSMHQGHHITVAYIRHLGFHVHKMRKAVSTLLSNCVVCRRLRGSFELQKMADLPDDRVEKIPPFMRSGVDVFGPYHVYDGKCTRRSSATKKIWVVLFTCLYSRAVHLEPIVSMDITSFNLALRRFTAIRGPCCFYRSDCGSNFVGAQNQLKENDMEKLISLDSQPLQPEWRFLPPHASHFAGVWERKVGSIKRVLNTSFLQLGNLALSREEFSTLLQEAAQIVNNTPLGPISSSANDPFPPTPATLLNLRDDTDRERESFDETDLLSYGRKRWRRVQYLADQFWIRWRRDYLHGLQARKKWTKSRRNVVKGDIVLIRDASPRNSWPMGIVTETKPNKDGLVRSVTIRLKPLSDKGSRFINRAVHDLVILIPGDSSGAD